MPTKALKPAIRWAVARSDDDSLEFLPLHDKKTAERACSVTPNGRVVKVRIEEAK